MNILSSPQHLILSFPCPLQAVKANCYLLAVQVQRIPQVACPLHKHPFGADGDAVLCAKRVHEKNAEGDEADASSQGCKVVI